MEQAQEVEPEQESAMEQALARERVQGHRQERQATAMLLIQNIMEDKEHQLDIDRIVDEYADTIYRICYSYGKNYHDSQDIMQNVFLKFMKKNPRFESKEHEKAWIIRVTLNACKDFLKIKFRQHVSLDEVVETPQEEKTDLSYVREAVKKLPAKYRDVIYLFYFGEYSALEIAAILHKKENTVYTWLNRGRKLLENELGGDL